jgi:hypothetical protein
MAVTDALDGDLTIDAVAAAIGVSERTVERRADEWGIAKRRRPQKGAPPVTVYDPTDVARVATERQPAAAVHVLSADPAGNGNGRTPTPASTHVMTRPYAGADDPSGHLAAALEAVLLRLFQSPPASPPALPPSPPVAETLWVDVAEAAALLGWDPRDVRKAVRTGALAAHNRQLRDWHRWRIRRTDLKELEAL